MREPHRWNRIASRSLYECGRFWRCTMPILLWVVFPFAVWSACMDQARSAQRRDTPKEFGG